MNEQPTLYQEPTALHMQGMGVFQELLSAGHPEEHTS